MFLKKLFKKMTQFIQQYSTSLNPVLPSNEQINKKININNNNTNPVSLGY